MPSTWISSLRSALLYSSCSASLVADSFFANASPIRTRSVNMAPQTCSCSFGSGFNKRSRFSVKSQAHSDAANLQETLAQEFLADWTVPPLRFFCLRRKNAPIAWRAVSEYSRPSASRSDPAKLVLDAGRPAATEGVLDDRQCSECFFGVFSYLLCIA